jgi:hypothetical protein
MYSAIPMVLRSPGAALSTLAGLSFLLTACSIQPGVPGGASALPVELSGELTSQSPLNHNDGSRYQNFKVHLRGGEAVKVTSSGALKAPVLILLDQDSRPVAGPASDRVVLIPERDGQYLLAVSGASDSAFGPFRLRLEQIEIRNDGALQPDSELVGVIRSGSPGNHYSLDVEEAARYELRLSSDAFDTLLKVHGGGLEVADDDGGGGTNSRLSLFLEPGSYQVTAVDYSGGAGGEYALAVSRQAIPADLVLTNGGVLQLGEAITGVVSREALEYSLELPREGFLRVDMRSEDVDSYLELSGNGINATDDDGAGNKLDARLQLPVQAGSYTLKAYAVDGGSGLFTLQAELLDARPAGDSIRPGNMVYGNLESGGKQTTRLRVAEAGRYRVELSSSAFDAELRVRGQNVDETDDDGAGGSNALLTLDLQPGDYEVISGSYADEGSGSYVLAVSSGN